MLVFGDRSCDLLFKYLLMFLNSPTELTTQHFIKKLTKMSCLE